MLVSAVLCLAAGSAGAQEEMIWPVKADLMYNDGDLATGWHQTGPDDAVQFWNTKNELRISVDPGVGLGIEEVAIHVVADPADFANILDKKGKPRLKNFDYQTLYLEDTGALAEDHLQVISFDVLKEQANICWGVPEKCPPNRYIVVAVDLHRETIDEYGNVVWEKLPETAYAFGNSGVFDRYPGTEAEADGIYWGYYVTYPLAKVEAGHFIDANVNGLAFATPTQSGVTGEEGQFWFLPGELIDFSVGSLPLGLALPDRRV